MTETNKRCSQLLPYFLKELSTDETDAFANHMSLCPSCQSELQTLQQAWQALPGEMDEMDVPDAKREQMWEMIVQQIQEPALKTEVEKTRKENIWKPIGTPSLASKRWLFPAAAAVLCIAVGAAVGWGLKPGDSPVLRYEVGSTDAPSYVVEQYELKAFDSAMPGASGRGWVRQQGESRQLVLEVNGLQANTGEQAYQLWVIKEGKRFNGGTFRVDVKGSSIMTCDLNVTHGTFEAIGITLEPDGKGTQPRGKKVLGT